MLFRVPSKKNPEQKRTRTFRGSKSLAIPGLSNRVVEGRIVIDGGYCIDSTSAETEPQCQSTTSSPAGSEKRRWSVSTRDEKEPACVARRNLTASISTSPDRLRLSKSKSN